MPALAPTGLAIAVVLSALGAVVLCILVVLYGFTPAGEEPPGVAARRLLVTRFGHAVAAVCFTTTAILIAVILAQPPRPAAPRAAPGDPRVPALGARLEGQESRLAQTEARLNDLERSLHREAARAAQITGPAPARVVAPLRRAPAPSAARVPLVVVEPAPAVDATPTPLHEMEASPPRFDLMRKLRDDWNTIRRGIESGEDDFRRALDDTRRNIRSLLGE